MHQDETWVQHGKSSDNLRWEHICRYQTPSKVSAAVQAAWQLIHLWSVVDVIRSGRHFTRLWGKDVSCLFNYASLFPLSSLVSFKENESAASSPVCWNVCFNCSAGHISSLWIVSNIFWLFIFRLSLFTKMSTPLSQLKEFCLLLSFSSPFSLVAILISLCTPPVPPSVLWRSSWIWSKAHRDSHPDQRLMLSRKARSKLDVWTRLLS